MIIKQQLNIVMIIVMVLKNMVTALKSTSTQGKILA